MSAYRVTRLARRDLDDIWLYIGERDVAAADRLIDKLTARFELVAGSTGDFPRLPDIGGDCQITIVTPYVIVFRRESRGVAIVRVIHGSRDFGRLSGLDLDD